MVVVVALVGDMLEVAIRAVHDAFFPRSSAATPGVLRCPYSVEDEDKRTAGGSGEGGGRGRGAAVFCSVMNCTIKTYGLCFMF